MTLYLKYTFQLSVGAHASNPITWDLCVSEASLLLRACSRPARATYLDLSQTQTFQNLMMRHEMNCLGLFLVLFICFVFTV